MVRSIFSKTKSAAPVSVQEVVPVREFKREIPVEEPMQIRLPIKGEEQYLSVADVAKLLQVEPPTVYRYIYAKKLKDIAIGGKRKIAKSEVERFANSYNQGERLRSVKK